jgi:hypothetical protein
MRRDILEASLRAFRYRRERWRAERRLSEAARSGNVIFIGDPPSQWRHALLEDGEDYEGTPLARVEL